MRTFHLVPPPFALAAFLLAAAAHAQTTTTASAGDPQSMATVVVNASADASAEGLSKTYAGGHDVTSRVRIDNVADRSYWASAISSFDAGSLVPAAPRTFVVSGSVAF